MNRIFQIKMKTQVKFNLIVLLVFLCFFLNDAISQEVYDLSRCIKTGLEQNFALQVVRNQEKIAENNYTPGNAGMLPTFALTNQFAGAINTTHQNLSTGDEMNTSGINDYLGSTEIDLKLNLFKGFQVRNTYQKLGKQSDLGGLTTQMEIENLVAKIVSEYNFYIQQLVQYDNLAYAVSLSRERVRIDEQRYLLGGASKLELLQSLVYLNADSSRLARQNEVLRSSQIRLNQLMSSDDPGKNIVLKDTLIRIEENLAYDELLELTLSNNTSIQIASKKQVISELDYKIIRSHSYPYLTFSTRYGYNYNKWETGNVSNQDLYALNYGLTLGIDIFDGLNRKREIKNARIETENRNIQYKEVEEEVRADLLTIYYAYQNNLHLLRLEEQNLEVARENLEIALERYKLGSLAGLELREVQKSLLDAEERLISVKYQTKLAEISLKQISGKILDYI